LLKFLADSESGQIPESEQVLISKNPRIILISPSFSKEITTTVLWLNERGLDIQCLEATPYKIEADIYLDLEQVIPLPEAKEYIVQRREKAQKEASTSLQRKQSDKPTKMTWTDDEKNPQEVSSWRALMESVIHRALAENLSPQQLPMPIASESEAAQSETFLSPAHFPNQKIYADLHGSSATIQVWIRTILNQLNVGGKKLGLQVDTASGVSKNFP